MLRTASAFLLFVLFAATAVSPGSAASAGRIALQTCTLPDASRPGRCGTLTVPEDPTRPSGRRIDIAVAVLPARSGRALPDPVVILLGGPGESAIDAAGIHERWLDPLLGDHDLVLVDQRGAGRSHPLACDMTPGGDDRALLTDIFPPAAVAACAKTLRQRTDLTRYGYADFARDLEQVRRGLGYGRLNLFAGSYGTRALQVFLRAYPASVRTAYFSSVVPIDIVAPQTMAATAAKQLDRMFESCAADAACREQHPELRAHFAALLDRLERGAVRVALPGQPGIHTMRRGPVAAWIRSRLYRPSSAAALPAAIDRAYAGDWQPIVAGIRASAHPDLSFGLLFAITCNEDMRFWRPVASARPVGFLGDFRVDQQRAACRFWPGSKLPDGYRTPIRSVVPALFSTGQDDGGTPVWFTDHAARGFSHAAIIVTPMQGHTEWNACIAARYFALVREARIRGPRRQLCTAAPRPAFAID
ncbi:alpha/beta fold hydrolase [Sphingomonas sp. BIUV-7]|uniref:Alpha/beta fold hydrolase n=1 Tax=Sphingomonas natans TaxID=3063330 RepID=A0ABT8Y5B0_9SPHN|nr:alpha/beta fold hydrolase [Sphingomonas sp. BIUV-7]MDO6413513.1 alpha/beta fold hydrolase [Sphingomonas sp. BIUV-7]